MKGRIEAMSFLIKFDSETQKYIARSPKHPSVIGEGSCLSEAIEDLETKITKLETNAAASQTSEMVKTNPIHEKLVAHITA